MWICQKCKCNTCVNSVDDEYYLEGDFSCMNCDECHFYGMDNYELTKNFKEQCSNYKMSKVAIERQAKDNRLKFTIIKNRGE